MKTSRSIIACVLFTLLTAIPASAANVDDERVISEVVVTAQRREQPKLMVAGNIQRLSKSTIDRVQHQHIHELLSQVAGAWVVRGSGQEHQR